MIDTIRKFAPRATNYLLFLLVILIPFSIRHVFDSTWNFQTGAYSDFTSLSLYICDLVLIALVSLQVIMKPKWFVPRIWKVLGIAAGLWLILELFLQAKSLLPLQAYFSLRFIFLLILAPTIANIDVPREKLAWLFSVLGAIQALIAIFQFYTQRSLGLYLIGESHLDPNGYGIAKIVSHGTKMIRSYGTFPHSNLLSAFLVVAIVFNLYLLLKSYQIPRGEIIPRGKYASHGTLLLYLLLALNIFGLFLSFSRAGMVGLGIIGLLIGLFLIYQREYKLVVKVLIPAGLFISASVMILFPYLTTRATITDNAVKERGFYNQIGAEILKDKPIFGIGPGTSVLHMKQYADENLQPWQIQPVHNYFLLSWVEWGIGSIFLFSLIIYPTIVLFMRKKEIWNIVLISISIAFLVLFLFDHYFYTIWPTQLLLWLIIGLVLKEASHETIYDTSSQ